MESNRDHFTVHMDICVLASNDYLLTRFAENRLSNGAIVVQKHLMQHTKERLFGAGPDRFLFSTEHLERIQFVRWRRLRQRRARSRFVRLALSIG